MTNVMNDPKLTQLLNVLATLILAGGQSRRMGSDKAMLKVPTKDGEQTLLDYHIKHGTCLKYRPVLVADNNKQFTHSYHDHALVHHIQDFKSGLGALSAIIGAMRFYITQQSTNAMDGYILVTSCDSLISFEQLYQQIQSKANLHFFASNELMPDVIYFYDAFNQKDYPLIGLYSVSLLAELTLYVESGQRGVMKFLNTKGMKVEKIDLPKTWQTKVNFNTPEEFEVAV